MSFRLPVTCLFALSFVCLSCSKPKPVPPPPPLPTYTSAMGGVRNWHGSHYYNASGPHFPTPINEFYYLPDTSFAITVLDDTTIQYLGTAFKYNSTDTTKQIYFFGMAAAFYQYGMGTGVAYYYAKDSIVYCQGDKHGTTDQWVLRNLRYTY